MCVCERQKHTKSFPAVLLSDFILRSIREPDLEPLREIQQMVRRPGAQTSLFPSCRVNSSCPAAPLPGMDAGAPAPSVSSPPRFSLIPRDSFTDNWKLGFGKSSIYLKEDHSYLLPPVKDYGNMSANNLLLCNFVLMLISHSWDTSCTDFLCGYSTAVTQATPSADTHGPRDAVPGQPAAHFPRLCPSPTC